MSNDVQSSKPEPAADRPISRRKLLAAMGMAGAAAVMSAYGSSAQAESVTEATYGKTGKPSLKPKELMNLSYCIPTTIAELRLNDQPSSSFAYYITDREQEGFFYYDPADTQTADNTGTAVVSASGARFKRAVDAYTVNVKWYGAKGDGAADDTLALQSALNEALRWPAANVIVPAGTYRMTAELYIFKNTHLKMDAQTVILRGHDGNVIRNYRKDDIFYEYGGNGNITIEGGILDCNATQQPRVCNGIALAHAERITLRNLTIKDTQSGHATELTGVRHVLIDRCKYIGCMFTTQTYVEAIQLEPALIGGFAGQTADHTPTQHVTVKDCYFGPSGTPGTVPWPCGVGAHGAYPGAYFDHIIVRDNVMERSTYWAIRPFKWRNSVIAGNQMKMVAGGIFVSTPSATSASSKDENGVFHPVQPASSIVIEHNILDTATNNGIYVEGFPEGSGDKIIIADNIFKNMDGQGISIRSNHCIVTGNLIEGAKKNGIYMTDCSNVMITNNLIRDTYWNGIQANNSKRAVIAGNSITNPGQNGDGTYDGISLTGTSSESRVTGNVVRTESGKKKLRYGLNAAATVTSLTRLQNDLRCGAVSGNLHDLSVAPYTSYEDLT
ncbi:right-handed parallel beta-helix repeat-containing protein [Paenibacillus sp. MBLB4367]|uniref:right-handed parallel beta-helix repeat-containing protein n=1 Tax=Paenibacillus sp. MBLB4367 TaxID=3384767 RepID=UPI0039084207